MLQLLLDKLKKNFPSVSIAFKQLKQLCLHKNYSVTESYMYM